VVLCGRNDRLRRRLRDAGARAVGWRDDMADLLAAAYAVVDNAAGLTCREAFAAGVPVVSYQPIPGHGRDGASAMARAGLSVYARSAGELVEALDRLDGTPERVALVARSTALFTLAPAESLLGCPPA
jgi:UDP-N-acetylglucosamine:LPS N-acetylglucosamine transferase